MSTKNQYNAFYSIFLIFLFLSPTLFFGFTADDRTWALSAEAFNQKQLAPFNLIIDRVQSASRLDPISTFLYTALFYIFDYQSAWLYHALLALLTTCSFLLFLNWLNRIVRISNKDWTWMVLVVLAATQFRLTGNDPIVSYHGKLQVVAILFFSSLIFLDAYIHNGKKHSLCLFAVTIILSLLTYELFVFLLPVYVYLLLKQKEAESRKRINIAIVLITLTISFLFLYFYRLFLHPSSYPGVTVHADPAAIILAFIWQFMGSLPLSYGVHLATEWFGLSRWIGWGTYAIVVITTIAYAYRVREQLGRQKEDRQRVGVLGALIWVCAAVATAPTLKYQEELGPGLAYIQVFIQNFGFAMIIYAIFNNQHKIVKYGLTIVVVLTFGMNLLVLNEAKKNDGATLLSCRTISNSAVMSSFSFETLLMNRAVFNGIDPYRKIAGKAIGKPVRWLVKDGFNSILKYENNTGIIVTELAWYDKSHSIIGKFNASTRSIENVTVVTSSLSRASQLVKIYGGQVVEKHKITNGYLFSFGVSRPISIPTGLVGKFR